MAEEAIEGLKRCPKCSGVAVLWGDYQPACSECNFEGPDTGDRLGNIEAWNELSPIDVEEALLITDSYGPQGADVNTDFQIKIALRDEVHRLRKRDELVGKWLSAALDDPSVCHEMQEDVRDWFDAAIPPSNN